MASETNNLDALRKFGSTLALMSPVHVEQIRNISFAPQRGVETTEHAMQQCATNYGIEGGSGKPFLFASGVAVIPVWGVLLHRDRWCDEYATGYDYIHAKMSAALGDPDVKGILWDINSYGGHVAGNFELCELIYQAREKKPMIAVVDSHCFSGGYSIASSIGKIVTTPSSQAGSIGVVMIHTSYEGLLDNAGIKVSFIHAGKHKVDGNPYQDLPRAVRDDFQKSVDRSWDKFVNLVARNRNMDPKAVYDTEARIYDSEEALSTGLIDEVTLPKDAFASFLKELGVSGSTPTKEAKKMTTEVPEGGVTAAQHNTAVSAAKAEGIKEGQQAAVQRAAAILNCEEGKNKPSLAKTLALDPNISVESAKAILSAAADEKPEAVAAAPTATALAAAMAAEADRTVGAGGGGDEEEVKKAGAVGSRIAATHAKVRGRELKTA